MPGAIPHIIAGFTLFIVGKFYYNDYLSEKNEIARNITLFLTCLFFSTIIDFVLIIYYLTKILPFDTMWPIHYLVHIIFLLFGILFFVINNTIFNLKIKPLINMAMICIFVHLIMDFFIPEYGIFI